MELAYIDPGNGFLLIQMFLAAVVGRLAFMGRFRAMVGRFVRRITFRGKDSEG